MAALPEESGCWLNSDSTAGVTVREDVRAAVAEVWRVACKKTRIAMGDTTETAGLMEASAARASRFLDRLGQGSVDANPRAILLRIFCRLLSQRAVRLRRLEPVGMDVEIKATAPSWEDEMNMLLFFEKLQHNLPPESVTILGLRRDGHVWDEIASMLKSSVPAVKKRFWRDIENAKVTLRIGPQGKSAGRAKVGRRNGGNGSAA
jgi:DNA-directed RNA polymerase specialized sigma24 family protein